MKPTGLINKRHYSDILPLTFEPKNLQLAKAGREGKKERIFYVLGGI